MIGEVCIGYVVHVVREREKKGAAYGLKSELK